MASAGRRATDRSDYTAAENLLRRSLAVGSSAGADRGWTLYRLGIALGEIDDFPGLFAAFDEAIVIAAASGDRSLEWLARINRTDMQIWADPFSRTPEDFREELEGATRAFDELGDEVGLATAWTRLAVLDFWPCRNDHAELAARRAVQHARRSDDEHLLGDALLVLLVAQRSGSATPEEGLATLDELSEDIARSRQFEAAALAVRGLCRSAQGESEQARGLVSLGVEIAEALGTRIGVSMYEMFLGDVEMEAGDPTAAERAYRRSYEIADEIGWEGFKTTPAGWLARMLCELGRFDEAERYTTIVRDATAADDLGPLVVGRSVEAVVLAARGRFDDAEHLGREAIRMFADAEDPDTQGLIRMDMARVLLMAGKIEEAAHAAQEALVFFERKGNRASSASTRTFLTRLGVS